MGTFSLDKVVFWFRVTLKMNNFYRCLLLWHFRNDLICLYEHLNPLQFFKCQNVLLFIKHVSFWRLLWISTAKRESTTTFFNKNHFNKNKEDRKILSHSIFYVAYQIYSNRIKAIFRMKWNYFKSKLYSELMWFN